MAKGLMLVLVPLVFELFFFGTLNELAVRAEKEAAVSERARSIDKLTNRLIKEIYGAITTIRLSDVARTGVVPYDRAAHVDNAAKTIAELRQICRDNPKQLAAVDSVGRAIQSANATIDELITAVKSDDQPRIMVLSARINGYKKAMLPTELVDMAEEARQVEERSPLLQASLREQVRNYLALGVAFSIFLSVILSIFVTRSITRRLAKVQENSMRLLTRRTLLAPLPGHDEIAQLDSVFHSVATELARSAKRERALVENARDIICSIDAQGRFEEVSAASEAVLGYDPDELVGRYFMETVAPDDIEKTRLALDRCKMDSQTKPFETRIQCKDGSVVDVLFSALWSESEQRLFCVVHDMSERKRVERLRQEVVAMVTHDLRSPLNTVILSLELLGEGDAGELNSFGIDLVMRAERAGQHMMTLVNDLLDLDKIESGAMALDLADVTANELFEACAQTIGSQARAKQVSIVCEPHNVMVHGDRFRLLQILINLCANAIKFSPSNSQIKMTALQGSESILITVKDQGPGIPVHKQAAIFERFQQLQSADAAKDGGSGLGLAICKALVELHGGKIWVESEEGNGSTFLFSIPVATNKLA
ncbi:MAG: PAS domain S-box protein [Cyanobacteria bacterium SZAS TMP-1]|nr:PAS domain S-box protein [Cyanobacteria bacterium SZAS TMP-1]